MPDMFHQHEPHRMIPARTPQQVDGVVLDLLLFAVEKQRCLLKLGLLFFEQVVKLDGGTLHHLHDMALLLVGRILPGLHGIGAILDGCLDR
jgi:hypothetical protein